VSVFGVFDGHGGAEVALYVKKHFIPTLTKNENFIKKDYKKALYETFLEMDVMI
jgi:protein phosphatase 1G